MKMPSEMTGETVTVRGVRYKVIGFDYRSKKWELCEVGKKPGRETNEFHSWIDEPDNASNSRETELPQAAKANRDDVA